MHVVFVHGWSVTNTSTYGGLPGALAGNAPASLDLKVTHLHLGKYVSFADEVTVDDIARGMQHAMATEVQPKLESGERFACITHSTGAPVTRKWIDLYYRGKLETCPLGHLVMLAPANHGSALAQLGKSRLARMKFLLGGVEPGRRVLDWLELGSDQSWELNNEWLDYDCVAAGLYPFVLTGQRIDRALYDHLNSYTGEVGSDGVVRVAAANLNYGLIRLVQNGEVLELIRDRRTRTTAMGVLPGTSHSGKKSGIMGSVKSHDEGTHPAVQWVLRCLAVSGKSDYSALVGELNALTARTQEDEKEELVTGPLLFQRKFVTRRYCMLVIHLMDDRGIDLSDYDVIFTAGPEYDADHLPPGFFVDRQRNQLNIGKLTYYIDYDVMRDWFDRPELEDKFGVQVRARPSEGFAHYRVAEHRGTFSELGKYFEPNRTMMIEIELRRHVREGVFQLTQDLKPKKFGNQAKGEDLP